MVGNKIIPFIHYFYLGVFKTSIKVPNIIEYDELKKQKFGYIVTFDSLCLHPKILKALAKSGYTKPTEIQLRAIPEIMKGSDLRAMEFKNA